MLRSVGAYLLAAVLLLHSNSAFRQALSEFRDTEPGSLLLGVLQVVIGTSAVASAIGLVRRARWAAWSVGVCGVATVALLAVQPLLTQMESEAQRAIWLGAAAIGVAAAGVSWFARRLAKGDVVSRDSSAQVYVPLPADGQLSDGQLPAEPIIAAASDAHVSRVASTEHRDEPSRSPGRASSR